MTSSSVASSGTPLLASTPESSAPTMDPSEKPDTSGLEEAVGEDPGDSMDPRNQQPGQQEEMEADDEEGMDVKAKALTKLLKTSSVSTKYIVLLHTIIVLLGTVR